MHAWSALHRWEIHAVDADVGRVEDVYFDDQDSMVRYLAVGDRHWPRGHHVLIPPAAVCDVDPAQRRLAVALTRAQVECCPSVDSAKPVSRQHCVDLYDYFGFPYDWTGSAVHRDPLAGVEAGDPHLRSARALTRYRVRAVGGEVGFIDDFLIEMPSWSIRYVVVRVGHGHARRLVLVAPRWLIRLSWEGRMLDVGVPAEAVRQAPRYDPTRPLDRGYEARLQDYYAGLRPAAARRGRAESRVS